jgi:hypothetical protein
MKKIIFIMMIFTLSLQAKMVEITNTEVFKESFLVTKEYIDWCDGEYVWREYKNEKRGSLVQVMINKEYMLSNSVVKIAQVKECKNK